MVATTLKVFFGSTQYLSLHTHHCGYRTGPKTMCPPCIYSAFQAVLEYMAPPHQQTLSQSLKQEGVRLENRSLISSRSKMSQFSSHWIGQNMSHDRSLIQGDGEVHLPVCPEIQKHCILVNSGNAYKDLFIFLNLPINNFYIN